MRTILEIFPAAVTETNMTLRSVTLIPLLLLLCLSILPDRKTAAVNIREKCVCIKETRELPWRHMTNFNVIDPGPLCNKVQIIIYTKIKSVCLAPKSRQGHKLQNCWKRIYFNEEKKKDCMRPKKGKKRRKKPATP